MPGLNTSLVNYNFKFVYGVLDETVLHYSSEISGK